MAEEKIKKDEMPGVARRRVPRRPINLNIGLLISGQYIITKALEIGEGGMLIESSVLLKKNQFVVMTIRMAGTLQCALLSRVVYIIENQDKAAIGRYGIQFENIEFDLKRKIRNFVASSSGSYVVRTVSEEKDFLEEY